MCAWAQGYVCQPAGVQTKVAEWDPRKLPALSAGRGHSAMPSVNWKVGLHSALSLLSMVESKGQALVVFQLCPWDVIHFSTSQFFSSVKWSGGAVIEGYS